MGKSSPQQASSPQYDFTAAQRMMNSPTSFAYPFGTGTMSGGNYNWVESPNQAQKRNISETNVNQILKGINTGMSPANDPYTQSFLNELLRESQPRTENALIGRGLGGSTVYRDALTDLMNKASTQAILNSREQKRADVGVLEQVLAQMNQLGMNVGQQNMEAQNQNINRANQLMNMEQTQKGTDWQTQLYNLQAQQQAEQQKWANLTNLALAGGIGLSGLGGIGALYGGAKSGISGLSNLFSPQKFTFSQFGNNPTLAYPSNNFDWLTKY